MIGMLICITFNVVCIWICTLLFSRLADNECWKVVASILEMMTAIVTVGYLFMVAVALGGL
jgi:hypothetical protein